jgi:hypothetical protein
VGESWLLWCGGLLAVTFAVLLALAGVALVGIFLAAVVWLAARRAVTAEARAEVDEALRRTCDRLPVRKRHPRSTAR